MEERRNDYAVNFKPLDHLQLIYNPGELTKEVYQARFACNCIHQFFLSHADNYKVSPPCVLDYACGPAIAHVISAAQYASEIVLAEYTDSSRDYLQKWVDKNPSSFDWLHFFNYIVQELEGKSKEEAVKREVILRQLIKAILPCDITKNPPIPDQYTGPYDILINTLMFDVTATTIEEYEQQMKLIASLIKPGGYLLCLTATPVSERQEEYCFRDFMLNGQKYNTLLVSKSCLKSMLERTGFNEIEFIDDPNGPKRSNHIFVFTIAQKKF